ncbi:unnamed protein product [Eruca vesicaria subsp. sativa]|uniref:Uncharacterized protein n=1 Tax=Eruca vesicaria subsp. sativa TaxID=29727 RepID=A0ABC8IY01_ERUVS|nr:unnamed protein product [Eruca vesicaria subsp. sativa]
MGGWANAACGGWCLAVRNMKAAHELIQQWRTKWSSSGTEHPLNITIYQLHTIISVLSYLKTHL